MYVNQSSPLLQKKFQAIERAFYFYPDFGIKSRKVQIVKDIDKTSHTGGKFFLRPAWRLDLRNRPQIVYLEERMAECLTEAEVEIL